MEHPRWGKQDYLALILGAIVPKEFITADSKPSSISELVE